MHDLLELGERTRNDPLAYEEQPISISLAVTEKEWGWLSSDERVRLINDMTSPDWEE